MSDTVRSRLPGRHLPSLLAVGLSAALVAACGGGPTPSSPDKWLGASGSNGAAGVASITVSGARSMTMSRVRLCQAGSSVLHLVLDATVQGRIYLLEISTEHADKPGDLAVGKAYATSADLSNDNGESWESNTAGSAGHVTVADGLRSGSVDLSLVSPSDASKVQISGTWSC